MGQRQPHLTGEYISQQRYIAAGIDTVYYYLSQPDRWHEWNPGSLRADTGLCGSLPAGHRFSEIIDLLGLQVQLSYRVTSAVLPREFRAVFSSAPLDGSIDYQLRKQGDGTLLKRTLHFSTDLNLGGLRSRMERLSSQALDNLKRVLEAPPG
ncbi:MULTISPECIES: SRPBCC family protein [Pseudomonas]|uniref:SRPBCC family protein n=1 Tax=Pseudomonas sessilinigenes TaxID=658629 RepID=A0ABX8MKB3_9PSED|nr:MULTISPECIES: SRPBCC family protein [Pseudomonas]AZC26832.1 hypothetical protein C4K39_5187 [Pseudomonas sessilinigenes]QIH07864.1 SRPBCC family protein [Pseudomonas sp. BIOMIG1BAC]QXH39192.1 SRPBCC family protein [Pseudomonas sessilinigenes]